MNLIILGAPGSGKGTQSVKLSKELSFAHISTGDMLREAVKSESELGNEAKAFMQKGQLVPDELVIGLIDQRIKQKDAEVGIIFDGFPRNINQAQSLDKILKENNKQVDTVINLDTKEDIIVQRLSGRWLCKNCGAIFHVTNMPAKKEGVCDHCGGVLYQRVDDKEETIKKRLDVYKKENASLIKFYKENKRFIDLDANEHADIVYKKIVNLVNDYNRDTSRVANTA